MDNKLIKLFNFAAENLPLGSKIHNDCLGIKERYVNDGLLTEKQLNCLRSMINTSILYKNIEIEFNEELKKFLNLNEVKTALRLT